MSNKSLENLNDVMPIEFYTILKDVSAYDMNNPLTFAKFFNLIMKWQRMSLRDEEHKYNHLCMFFQYYHSDEIFKKFSDKAIKDLYNMMMSSILYVSSKTQRQCKFEENELITKEDLQVWSDMSNKNHMFYDVKNFIEDKNGKIIHETGLDIKSSYQYVFKTKVFLNLFVEMKKRKLFHDNSFTVTNDAEVSSLIYITQNLSVLKDFLSCIKIKKDILENTVLSLGEQVFRKEINELYDGIKNNKGLSTINNNITGIGIVFNQVWVIAKKYKNENMLQWLNENMQTTQKIIKEYSNKNGIVNQKNLNLLNLAIYKTSLKLDFAKNYYYVKYTESIKEKWNNVKQFPLDIVDSKDEPLVMERVLTKKESVSLKYTQANILKVNRKDFLNFHIVRGEKTPDENSTNKVFLPNLLTRIKELSPNYTFKKSLESIKTTQNLDYFYIVIRNEDSVPKDDFNFYCKILFREIVDCNKIKEPSLENLEAIYEKYLMEKDVKPINSMPKKVLKF